MVKKVIVLSRHNFIKFVNSLTDKQKREMAFISIRDFDHEIILNNASNVLNLQFDDSETEESWTNKLFDDELAQQIIQFVNNNLDKNLFVVHCLMGQSRSGAVGGFLADIFGIKWEDFKRQNSQVKPNTLVKTTLEKNYYGRYQG
jgi:predicted protein tyrosine phosphatase